MKNVNILYILIIIALVIFIFFSLFMTKQGIYRFNFSLIAFATIIIVVLLTLLYIHIQNLPTSLRSEFETKFADINSILNEKVTSLEKVIEEFRKHHLRCAKINFKNKDYINAYNNYFLSHELKESLYTVMYIMYCCCMDNNLPDSFIFFDSALRCSLNPEQEADWLKEAADEIIKLNQLKTEVPNFNELLCHKVKSIFLKQTFSGT
jgi:hypothetical protein